MGKKRKRSEQDRPGKNVLGVGGQVTILKRRVGSLCDGEKRPPGSNGASVWPREEPSG